MLQDDYGNISDAGLAIAIILVFVIGLVAIVLLLT